MKRVAAIAVCGLTLSACSSMPSLNLGLPQAAPPTNALQLESMPPGADARASTGGACRTPCALAVAGEEMSVTFTLPGYQPQTVPVRMVVPNEPINPDDNLAPAPRLAPNPVVAQLLALPPPVVKKKPAPRPKTAAPAGPKAAPPAANPAPAPAPAAAWPPPPPAR